MSAAWEEPGYGFGCGLAPDGTSGHADVEVLQLTPPPPPPLPFGCGVFPAGTSGVALVDCLVARAADAKTIVARSATIAPSATTFVAFR